MNRYVVPPCWNCTYTIQQQIVHPLWCHNKYCDITITNTDGWHGNYIPSNGTDSWWDRRTIETAGRESHPFWLSKILLSVLFIYIYILFYYLTFNISHHFSRKFHITLNYMILHYITLVLLLNPYALVNVNPAAPGWPKDSDSERDCLSESPSCQLSLSESFVMSEWCQKELLLSEPPLWSNCPLSYAGEGSGFTLTSALLQMSHYSFFPMWVHMCRVRWSFSWNVLLHTLHS